VGENNLYWRAVQPKSNMQFYAIRSDNTLWGSGGLYDENGNQTNGNNAIVQLSQDTTWQKFTLNGDYGMYYALKSDSSLWLLGAYGISKIGTNQKWVDRVFANSPGAGLSYGVTHDSMIWMWQVDNNGYVTVHPGMDWNFFGSNSQGLWTNPSLQQRLPTAVPISFGKLKGEKYFVSREPYYFINSHPSHLSMELRNSKLIFPEYNYNYGCGEWLDCNGRNKFNPSLSFSESSPRWFDKSYIFEPGLNFKDLLLSSSGDNNFPIYPYMVAQNENNSLWLMGVLDPYGADYRDSKRIYPQFNFRSLVPKSMISNRSSFLAINQSGLLMALPIPHTSNLNQGIGSIPNWFNENITGNQGWFYNYLNAPRFFDFTDVTYAIVREDVLAVIHRGGKEICIDGGNWGPACTPPG
jgi:hypothetical protein